MWKSSGGMSDTGVFVRFEYAVFNVNGKRNEI